MTKYVGEMLLFQTFGTCNINIDYPEVPDNQYWLTPTCQCPFRRRGEQGSKKVDWKPYTEMMRKSKNTRRAPTLRWLEVVVVLLG